MYIGLAAQGIDPTTGKPVGDYVVCRKLAGALSHFSTRGNVDLGRRIGQLLRVSHQVRTSVQHERSSLGARMGHCGRQFDQSTCLCKFCWCRLGCRALTVCRGPGLVTGCTWPIGMGEEPNDSSAHTWHVSTPGTSSTWVPLAPSVPCARLTIHGSKGGRLLNNQTIVDFGLELNEGCWNTYEGSP